MKDNNPHIIEVAARESEHPSCPPETLNNLCLLSWISYGMHLIVAVCVVIPGLEPSMLLLVLAIILDLAMRSEARGSWQQSHFAWRIRGVALALLLYIVTSPLFLLLKFPGVVAWFFVSLWFLVRILKGMIAMGQQRPIA